MKLFNLIIATALTFAVSAQAANEAAQLQVEGGYVFQPMTGSNATAGYGIFKNTTNKDATLAIVSAEGFKAVELHETVESEGRMNMRKVENFQIKKNGSFELKPGGHHIMLFDATKEFKEDDEVKVSFKFNSKDVTIPFKIKLRGNTSHMHH